MAWRTGLGGASLRARVLLAARWPSALALGVVAGIGAGAVIGLLTIARDTGSMRFRPGADRAAVLDAAVPGQTRNVAQGVAADDLGDTRGDGVYEGRAAVVAAGVLAAAVAVLLGQMFVRQARRELPDGPALRALGMTRRALVLSVIPRWLVTAAVTLGSATVLSAFLRPFGPDRGGRPPRRRLGCTSWWCRPACPQPGQPTSSSYEGDGYVIVRHRDTAVVERALDQLITTIRVELE